MKIISLTATNVKRLSAVHVVPKDKGLVIVSGKNGAGKSSVLDAIEIAIGGGELPKRPVRRGEEKASIEIDLGDLTVRRTITPEGGGTLIVRNKDNAKLTSPQTILDSLYGKLSFDPLEFFTQKADKQRETLSGLLGLKFEAEDAEHAKLFDERTAINRDCKSIEAQALAISEHKDAPAEEVLSQAILDEQQKAIDSNKLNEDSRRALADLKNQVSQAGLDLSNSQSAVRACEDEIKKLNDLLAKHREAVTVRENARKVILGKVEQQEAVVSDLKDVDLSSFRTRLSEVEATNTKVRSNKRKAELRGQWKEKNAKSESLTDAMAKIEKSKRDKILAAKFPVPGLSINDQTREVEYNGLPLEQASTAERLRVSVAMGIAMNPKLRVLLVRQGNDLDDDNLKLLGELADEFDSQVWVERVSTEGGVSVIIEDGHVAEPKEKQAELA